METKRIFNAIIMQLNLDYFKLENELEIVLNSNISLSEKIKQTKKLLKKITTIELSISKFNNMAIIDSDLEKNNN
jgi:hypothetical protein